jgi:hypothetical protein
MRNRAFRRYMEEVKVIKRIKERGRSYYWGYRDCNDIKFQNPIWVNKIGSEDHFNFKTITTTRYDSKNKCKYGKRNNSRWREGIYRAKDKQEFYKMLVDNNLKHRNVIYEFESFDT